MATKNKSNLQKVTKSLYIILLIIFSYYILIGKMYGTDGSVHESIEDFITKKITNHWYSKCPENKTWDCKGRYEIIEIDGVKIDVNNYTPGTTQILSKWNKQRGYSEFKWVYFNDVMISRSKATDLASKITWALFFLTIPLIWLSRSLSLRILNSMMSLFNKGWKKI